MATSVASYVRELLYEQDCVVIPDFGGFIAHFLSAGFQTTNGGYQPPKKRIAFNEVLKFDDGLLSNYIAYRQQLTRGESLEQIALFVREIKDTLAAKNNYYFEHVGIFTLNKEGKLLFEPSDNTNFFAEGFGLATLFLHPAENQPIEALHANPVLEAVLPKTQEIEANEDVQESTDAPIPFVLSNIEADESQVITLPQRSFPWWLAACVAFLVLCSISLFLFKPDATRQVSLSSFNPLLGLVEKLGQPKASSKTNQFPVQVNSQAYTDSVVKTLFIPKSHPLFTNPVQQGDNSFDTNEKYQKADTTFVVKTEEAIVLEKTNTLIQSKTRYWVIGGAFESRRNANKFKRHLEKYGYKHVIVLPPAKGEYLFKVASNGFQSFGRASRASQELTQLLGEEAWVMKAKSR